MIIIYQTLIFFFLAILLILIFNSYSVEIAEKMKLVDKPDLQRKIHKNNTPILGGLMIFVYVIIIFLIDRYILINQEIFSLNYLLLLIPFFFLGLLDDILNLKSYLKLSIIYIYSLLIIFFVFEELILRKIYFETFERIFEIELLTGSLITALCISLLINAFNMSDGINSLANGIAIIWFSISFIFFPFSEFNQFKILLIIILFLQFFQIFKEKFFLGDSGSIFISSIISILTIYDYNMQTNNMQISVEKIVLVFFIPGIDMMRLFVTRLLNKKNPFEGDRNHLHHLLLYEFGIKKTLIVYYLLITFPIFLCNMIDIYILYIILLFFYFIIFFKLQKN